MPLQPPNPPKIPGASFSALDVISFALRVIGVLDATSTPDSDSARDGLIDLNQMMDAWNAESLMIFTRLIQDFNFVPSQQVYTLGSGGNFNVERPAEIERASVVLVNNPQAVEIPIKIYSDQEWQQVTLKAVDSTFPLSMYDDGGFPFRSLSFWPIPRDTSSKFRMYSWAQLLRFADLSTSYSFPPAYAKAIKYNLALELAPQYPISGRDMSEVAFHAQSSIAKIKAANTSDEQMSSDLVAGLSNRKIRNELFSIP